MATVTPMMRQYRRIKADHPNAILLFRMGDFYEIFEEDAKQASRALEITLTARGKGTATEVPMCGVPYHAAESYIARLLDHGFRVAVCDQVEDARKAKGLVKRAVTRVITPGTAISERQAPQANTYLLAVAPDRDEVGLAVVDLSTGEFRAGTVPAAGPEALSEELPDHLERFPPKEVVYPDTAPETWTARLRGLIGPAVCYTPAPGWHFTPEQARTTVTDHFKVLHPDGLGFAEGTPDLGAAGALLTYLRETQKGELSHLDRISRLKPPGTVLLDATTLRNLEVVKALGDGGKRGSLFGLLDETRTPMGGRLLRRWLTAPLRDRAAIEARLDAVEALLEDLPRRDRLRERLGRVLDTERLLAKIILNLANARDLLALKQCLAELPGLRAELTEVTASLLEELVAGWDDLPDLTDLLARAIHESPPATLRDGGLIRDGYHEELDRLRGVQSLAKELIARMEAEERERIGIASLKIKFNQVFGYYIEVTRPNLAKVPQDRYHRKQTTANAERFFTEALKELENEILTAQERILSLEVDIFQSVREKIIAVAPRVREVADRVARLDALTALAQVAFTREYARPRILTERRISIREGRHPVIETAVADRFIPNHADLEAGARQVAIITGPNMGGKSTFLRQVALITLLGHVGSFVPAQEAEIGLVDQIFTRVGASDALLEGKSTFMVEMAEVANILNQATADSLVVLDEVGRGTATYDGLSLAWAVTEHLHDRVGALTLFATHYQELTELADRLPGVDNLRVAVREYQDDILFLRKVEPGRGDKSYGLQVAKLAGLPAPVVHRAQQILDEVTRERIVPGAEAAPQSAQPALFAAPDAPLRDALRALDLDQLTPLEALALLAEWQRRWGKP